jgi:hypothetical protein
MVVIKGLKSNRAKWIRKEIIFFLLLLNFSCSNNNRIALSDKEVSLVGMEISRIEYEFNWMYSTIEDCFNLNNKRYETQMKFSRKIKKLFENRELENGELGKIMHDYFRIRRQLQTSYSDYERKDLRLNCIDYYDSTMNNLCRVMKFRNALDFIFINTCTSELDMDVGRGNLRKGDLY